LDRLSGHLRFEVDPEHLLDVEVQVPWLKIEVRARVAGGRLRADVDVRGLGIWWPTLEPLFLAGSSKIQQGLDETVHDLAEGLTSLPTADTSARAFLPPRRPSAAEREATARAGIEAGMAEIGRRQHAADEVVRLLPWWRRTRSAWQSALDDQPAASWPPGDALGSNTWPGVEGIVTYFVLQHPRWRRGPSIDAEVERVGAAQLTRWRDVDEIVSGSMDGAGAPAGPAPWLTDAATDLAWLATPWSTMRHLMGTDTEDEAKVRTEALAAGQVS
jgi:hypothetical protein